jgi:tRNA(Ile2) C34 agmatinyltransferase TiaS
MNYGNAPAYNERGERVYLREVWRRPERPFRAPTCCRRTARRIGFNAYRCPSCAARIEPERLWHRLMLTRNPFRRGEPQPWRVLVRVVRWSR